MDLLAQIEITVWTIHKIPVFLIVVFIVTPILYWKLRKVVLDAKRDGIEETRILIEELKEFNKGWEREE